MPGLVLVIACYSFPYMFVFTRSALDLISSEMEDAANILGAGVLRTTLRVTLPLALPAILGAFILVFLEAIALFGSPALHRPARRASRSSPPSSGSSSSSRRRSRWPPPTPCRCC